MHEDTSHPADPQRPADEHITERKGESLFATTHYPAFPAKDGPAAASGRPQRSTFQRVVLPLGILIGAIAAIAWVTQYLPSWRSTEKAAPSSNVKAAAPCIVFYQVDVKEAKDTGGKEVKAQPPQLIFLKREPNLAIFAIWDLNIPGYRLEFEPQDSGYYDYLFVNEANEPAEIGLDYQSCTCSKIRMCALPEEKAREHSRKAHEQPKWSQTPTETQEPGYDWKDMTVDKEKKVGLVIPAKQGGLVRLVWSGERAKEDLLLRVWVQPKGNMADRRLWQLRAGMAPAEPIRFSTQQLEFGAIPESGATQKFWCWSGTRPSFTLEFPENMTNPCIQGKSKALTPEECQDLTYKLFKDKQNAKVLSGYLVSVTVTPKKDGKELDMGLLYKPLHVGVEKVELVHAPIIRGLVPGDVRVAGKKTAVLDLEEFWASDGVKNRKFTLFTKPGVKLKYGKSDPKGIQVDGPREKGMIGEETAWDLTISIGGNQLSSGPLENNYIQLDSIQPDGSVRPIRLPLTGMGKSKSKGGF